MKKILLSLILFCGVGHGEIVFEKAFDIDMDPNYIGTPDEGVLKARIVLKDDVTDEMRSNTLGKIPNNQANALTYIDTKKTKLWNTGKRYKEVVVAIDSPEKDFLDNLPDMQDALDFIDNASDLATVKVILKKMVRAIYALEEVS